MMRSFKSLVETSIPPSLQVALTIKFYQFNLSYPFFFSNLMYFRALKIK